MRSALDMWMEQTKDLGMQPESEAMYVSDMAVYLQKIKTSRQLQLRGFNEHFLK